MALHSLNHDFIVHETLVLVLRTLDFTLSYNFILYYQIELYSTLVKVFRSKTYFIVPVNCEWVKSERFEVVQILQLKVRTSMRATSMMTLLFNCLWSLIVFFWTPFIINDVFS